MLTQILQLRRLHDKLVDLRKDVQLITGLEVSACQLLRYPIQDLKRTGILHLGRVLVLLAVDAVGASIDLQTCRYTSR